MAVASRSWMLTLLAALHFVFACTRLIGGLDALRYPQQPGSVTSAYGMSLVHPSLLGQYAMGGWQVLSSGLLVVAGIGYLRRSERLGRRLGSGLALLSLILVMVQPLLLQARGTGLLLALSCLFPLATLYILNVSQRTAFTAK